jgi:4-hydroxy-2-oxoheptanedioate aldolase
MNNVVIAFMIEKRGAMENLEEILSVKGVDMVQFGPGDYSTSIGKVGQGQAPEVQNAHYEMIKMALKKGVAARVEIGSFEDAKPYIDMGVRHFCMGWDISVISQWCKQQEPGLRKLLS